MAIVAVPADALHVAVDMQVLFDSGPQWGSDAVRRALPNVLKLARARPQRTIFTRFVPPGRAEDAHGQWRRYYERWSEVPLERSGRAVVELVPELRPLSSPQRIFDKRVYSAFGEDGFAAVLKPFEASCLVFSGVETDVCVLATLLGAVDRGYRAVLAVDAVASSDPTGHESSLALLCRRFGEQVECASSDAILAAWPTPR